MQNVNELLEQKRGELAALETQIAEMITNAEGLNKYGAQLDAVLKKLVNETIPAHNKRMAELGAAREQVIGAIGAYEKLTEQTQAASA